jgi:ABC-type transport system involved in multi-copper enzyme maturation permease subunit
MKGAFRDMLLWPVIGLGIGMGGGIFVAILLGLLNWFTTSSRLGFWVTHVLTFPAGFVWTDIFQAIGKTPWFWLAVPVAITIHCLRQAWLTAAWLEPTRTQEQVQARRRARAAQEAAGLLGARPPAPGAPWAPPRVPTPQEQRAIEMRTPWATMAQRLRNPIEVLAALHKRDAAWYFAIFGWFVPLLIVGSPVLFSEGLIRERSVFPSLGALFWVGLMVAYACMVTPTVVTAEREGGTLDSLRMTRLGPADIIWGKLKPRWLELGVLYLGGAVFMSIFTTFGSLTLPSLVLLWVSAPVYVAAYAGVGALASVWSRRSTHAILAVWALLAVPAMLSLAMIGIAGAVGHWGLLPLSPPLTVFRCLVFRLPDPTGPSLWLPHLEAYAVWGLSIVIHVVLAAICWWTALRRFDRWLFENQDRGR